MVSKFTLKHKLGRVCISGIGEMLDGGKLGLMVENSEDGIYNGMKRH
jgi:hypothetical protein